VFLKKEFKMIYLRSVLSFFPLIIHLISADQQRYKFFQGKSIKSKVSAAISTIQTSNEGICLSKCKDRSDCAGITFYKSTLNCILIHCGRIDLESKLEANTFVKGVAIKYLFF